MHAPYGLHEECMRMHQYKQPSNNRAKNAETNRGGQQVPTLNSQMHGAVVLAGRLQCTSEMNKKTEEGTFQIAN